MGRLLDEADAAVREVQTRIRDWTADGPALAEIVLRDTAAAVVAPHGKSAGAAEAPVPAVLRRVLAQRDQMAHALTSELQKTLLRTLEGMRRAAPLAPAEAAPVRELTFRGLPAPDLSPLRERLDAARPRWAAVLPPLAVWAVRNGLERRLGAPLREQVVQHDRQLRAWLRATGDSSARPAEGGQP